MMLRKSLRIAWIAVFLGVIMVAPAMLGANRGWSVGILAMTLVGCTAALSVFRPSWFSLERGTPLRRIAPLVVGAIVVFLIAYAGLFRGGMGPAFDLANSAAAVSGLGPDQVHVRQALLGYISACLAFLLSYLLISKRPHWARACLLIGVAVSTGYALYGVLTDCLLSGQWFGAGGATCGHVSGPFILYNSLATYLGLALVVAFVLLIASLKSPRTEDDHRSMKRRIVEFGETAFGPSGLLVSAILVLGAALLLTQSRGGTTATALALAVAAVLLVRGNLVNWRHVLPASFVLMAALLFVWVSAGSNISNRIAASGFSSQARLQIYEATIQMIAERPLTGHGFGNFQETIQRYRSWEMGPYPDWDKAHNSYLEIVAGLGIPGAILFFALFGWIVWRCVRGLIDRKRDRIYPIIGIASTVLIAAHALVDFSMQIPAVEVIYAFIMGICVAGSYPRHKRTPRSNT